MRVVVNTKVIGGPRTLPFSPYPLAGAIYSRLNSKFHDMRYKPFSFSNIRVLSKFREVRSNALYVKPNNGAFDTYFYISSLDDEVLGEILAGILKNPVITVGDTAIGIVEVKSYVEPDASDVVFRTITPVLLKNPAKGRFIGIRDKEFYDEFEKSIRIKLDMFGGSIDKIEVLSLRSSPTYFKFGDKWAKVPATHVEFRVRGDADAIRTIYHTGVGNKTGLGYGFVKIVKVYE